MSKNIILSNGCTMPLIGLGTWLSKPGEVKNAVKYAIEVGYKHIDCAWAYQNEEEVGEALSEVLANGVIKREDLFVTSKLWNSFHRPEEVLKGVQEALRLLKLDYLDLYLVHWPVAYKPGILFPSKESIEGDIDEVDLLSTWKAMESLVDSGKVKTIGLSNFNIPQIQNILDNCRIKPLVLQIELHVYFPNKKLVEYCQKHDIKITAYSPLGAPARPEVKDGDIGPLNDPHVLAIAIKLKVTPGQVLIAYVMHRGIVCIPKSISPLRIKENFHSLDITFSKEDFEVLDNLNVNRRFIVPSIMAHHKDYPFEEK